MDTFNNLLSMSNRAAVAAFSQVSELAGKYGLPPLAPISTTPAPPPPPPPPPMTRAMHMINLFGSSYPGNNWIRLAGLSGALAVGLSAYGAHGLKDLPDRRKTVFDTASKYHFIHSLAMLAVPLCNRPHLVGTLMFLGTSIFSGTCYVHALTGNETVTKYTPYGGLTLIAAWLAMIL